MDSTQIKAVQEAVAVAKPDEPLNRVIEAAWSLGVPKERLVFSPTTARGLDYYTGAIYETIVTKAGIGSVTGGGRYDDLVEKLGGPKMPATGTTLGLDRLCDVLEILGLVPKFIKESANRVLVCLAEENEKVESRALEIVKDLRAVGVASEVYLVAKALDKQLKYASEKGIEWVVILGSREVAEKKLTVKNLRTRSQEELSLADFKKLVTK